MLKDLSDNSNANQWIATEDACFQLKCVIVFLKVLIYKRVLIFLTSVILKIG